jgi:hypothetical protein
MQSFGSLWGFGRHDGLAGLSLDHHPRIAFAPLDLDERHDD